MKSLLPVYRSFTRLYVVLKLDRLYPINVFASTIARFLFSRLEKLSFAKVQGHKMYLDSGDFLNLSVFGVWERYETELIKKCVKSGDVVIDIGANIGYYTLILAKAVGENGCVFAFEPEETNFALLKKNIEVNGYKNVILFQTAVTDKTQKLRLYLSKENPGDHRIFDIEVLNTDVNRQSIEVDAIRLDDCFKNRQQKVDLIKIDAEGAEYGIIKGMLNLLGNNNKIKIFTEFWPVALRKIGIDPKEFIILLINLGFKLYDIDEQKKRIEPIIVTELEKHIPDGNNYTNLLCVK